MRESRWCGHDVCPPRPSGALSLRAFGFSSRVRLGSILGWSPVSRCSSHGPTPESRCPTTCAVRRWERRWGVGRRSHRPQRHRTARRRAPAESGFTLGRRCDVRNTEPAQDVGALFGSAAHVPEAGPAPCHPNANPLRRVSAALSVTLQLRHTAPKPPRTTNVRRRRSGSVLRCVTIE